MACTQSACSAEPQPQWQQHDQAASPEQPMWQAVDCSASSSMSYWPTQQIWEHGAMGACVWPVQFQMVQQPQQDFYGEDQRLYLKGFKQGSQSSGAADRQQHLLQLQMKELEALQQFQQDNLRNRRQDRKSKAPAVQAPKTTRRNQRETPVVQSSLPAEGKSLASSGKSVPSLSLQFLASKTKESWADSSEEGTNAPALSDKAMETLDSLPSIFFPPTPESTPSNSPRHYGHGGLASVCDDASTINFGMPIRSLDSLPCMTAVFAQPLNKRMAKTQASEYVCARHSEAECEALLQQLNDASRKEEAIKRVTESAWSLATSLSGTRVVQHALSVAAAPEQIALAKQLRGQVLEAAACPNANHVLQKCVELVPSESLQFILEEMSGHVVTIARHRYGCRVLERLIERAWQTESLVDEVLADTSQLCRHPFGNFVVQHVLKLGTPVQRRSIVEILHTDIQRLARHRVASHVVRCAMANGSSEDRQRLVSALTDDASSLADLAHHHCGSYVVREIRREKHQ